MNASTQVRPRRLLQALLLLTKALRARLQFIGDIKPVIVD